MSRRLLYSRRAVTAGLTASILAGRADANESSLAFLLIGDWGKNSESQRAVAQTMARVAADERSRFVISTGDNFYENGVASVSDPLWRDAFETVYDQPALQIPWFPVLGNHDHRGSIGAQIAYSVQSPRWRMRARYWREDMRLDAGAASFFFLDTTPLTRLPTSGPRTGYAVARAQLQWLDQELARSRSAWKIVVGHHPIFSGGTHGPNEALDVHLRPVLERRGVAAYFNGHDHNLEHLAHNGVHYVCSGAGAAPRTLTATAHTQFGCAELGFAACSLWRRALSLAFHDANGAVIYRTEIEPRPEMTILADGRAL